jgi:glycosyltransferase involved in cell wall biosynthesis
MQENNMKDNNAVISVIVPIYNVELYLKRCVDSIVEQSYANIEIILVDDGATDNSPDICDSYAKTDYRIRVVHKENGGLSSARNAGINIMNGEYVLFIDSDDYIEKDMISKLYLVAQEKNADIVTCQFIKVFDDGHHEYYTDNKNMKTWTGEQSLVQMFYPGGIGWSACNKMYRAALFKNVRYVEGVYWEDMATTYKLYEKCNVVVETPYRLYFYYIRNSGITGKKSTKRAHDAILITEELAAYYAINHPQIQEVPLAFYGKIAPNFLVTLVCANEYEEIQKKCFCAIKRYSGLAIKADFVKKKYKVVILAFRIMLGLFDGKMINSKWFRFVFKKVEKHLH